MSMIEQARNAVADYLARNVERDTLACDLTGDEQRGLVRAVLEALREPTPEMVEAFQETTGIRYDWLPTKGWQAMIDAALSAPREGEK